MIYSFVFSIRRLLDVGIATKAEAFFWILGFSTIANLLAVGIGKPTLLVTYTIYYGGLLLWPSAKPRPMWTQEPRQRDCPARQRKSPGRSSQFGAELCAQPLRRCCSSRAGRIRSPVRDR
jgi:hypothetical protein